MPEITNDFPPSHSLTKAKRIRNAINRAMSRLWDLIKSVVRRVFPFLFKKQLPQLESSGSGLNKKQVTNEGITGSSSEVDEEKVRSRRSSEDASDRSASVRSRPLENGVPAFTSTEAVESSVAQTPEEGEALSEGTTSDRKEPTVAASIPVASPVESPVLGAGDSAEVEEEEVRNRRSSEDASDRRASVGSCPLENSVPAFTSTEAVESSVAQAPEEGEALSEGTTSDRKEPTVAASIPVASPVESPVLGAGDSAEVEEKEVRSRRSSEDASDRRASVGSCPLENSVPAVTSTEAVESSVAQTPEEGEALSEGTTSDRKEPTVAASIPVASPVHSPVLGAGDSAEVEEEEVKSRRLSEDASDRRASVRSRPLENSVPAVTSTEAVESSVAQAPEEGEALLEGTTSDRKEPTVAASIPVASPVESPVLGAGDSAEVEEEEAGGEAVGDRRCKRARDEGNGSPSKREMKRTQASVEGVAAASRLHKDSSATVQEKVSVKKLIDIGSTGLQHPLAVQTASVRPSKKAQNLLNTLQENYKRFENAYRQLQKDLVCSWLYRYMQHGVSNGVDISNLTSMFSSYKDLDIGKNIKDRVDKTVTAFEVLQRNCFSVLQTLNVTNYTSDIQDATNILNLRDKRLRLLADVVRDSMDRIDPQQVIARIRDPQSNVEYKDKSKDEALDELIRLPRQEGYMSTANALHCFYRYTVGTLQNCTKNLSIRLAKEEDCQLSFMHFVHFCFTPKKTEELGKTYSENYIYFLQAVFKARMLLFRDSEEQNRDLTRFKQDLCEVVHRYSIAENSLASELRERSYTYHPNRLQELVSKHYTQVQGDLTNELDHYYQEKTLTQYLTQALDAQPKEGTILMVQELLSAFDTSARTLIASRRPQEIAPVKRSRKDQLRQDFTKVFSDYYDAKDRLVWMLARTWLFNCWKDTSDWGKMLQQQIHPKNLIAVGAMHAEKLGGAIMEAYSAFKTLDSVIKQTKPQIGAIGAEEEKRFQLGTLNQFSVSIVDSALKRVSDDLYKYRQISFKITEEGKRPTSQFATVSETTNPIFQKVQHTDPLEKKNGVQVKCVYSDRKDFFDDDLHKFIEEKIDSGDIITCPASQWFFSQEDQMYRNMHNALIQVARTLQTDIFSEVTQLQQLVAALQLAITQYEYGCFNANFEEKYLLTNNLGLTLFAVSRSIRTYADEFSIDENAYGFESLLFAKDQETAKKELEREINKHIISGEINHKKILNFAKLTFHQLVIRCISTCKSAAKQSKATLLGRLKATVRKWRKS